MRVALAGGTGFIGGHLLRALLAQGHEVRAFHRRESRPSLSHSRLRWVEGRWEEGGFPSGLFEGCEAALNTVGLIQEGRGGSYEEIHVQGALAFFGAARESGCSRLLQLSALGADPAAAQAFLRSKGEADHRLVEAGECLILRPSVVYGAGDFSMATLARLARWPLTPLPGGGAMRLQPLWVGDLVEAMIRAMAAPAFEGGVVELGGPEALNLRDLLALLRGRPPRFLAIPAWAMSLGAALGGLLGHRLLNPEAWAMLRAGSVCDPEPLRRLLGRDPVPIELGVGLRNPGR